MGIEQEAICFVGQLAEMYFSQRDVNGLLIQMCPETTWLGTGEKEISKNLLDAKQALEKEFAEYSGSFHITTQELCSSQLSDTVCVVYGLICAVPNENLVEEQNLHITVVCLRTNDGMKLAHCNVSRPDYLQGENNYYVPPRTHTDNKTLLITLKNNEKQLKNLIRNIPGGVHQCLNDQNLTLLSMSDSFLEMFGYTQEEIEILFKNKFINMIYPADRADMLRIMNKQLSCGITIEVEYRVMNKNNDLIWILDKGRLLNDNDGNECFYCVLIEIAQRKYEQEQLRLSLERHHIIMDQAADIIFEWDIAADTLDFSSNWQKKFGYSPIESQISRKIPNSKNIYSDDMPAFVKIMKDTATGVPYSETEMRIRDFGGKYRWNRIRATTQFDQNGCAIKAVGVITDISDEKEERMALIEQAQRDALTGLYNKSAIKSQVEHLMSEATSGEKQALLIIDVDNFKQVNDTYGHLCGDTLLSDVAQVLKHHFRSDDIIGRIGGDEFLVYLPMVKGESIVLNKSESVLSALSEVRPAPDAAHISCSIGAVVLPRNGIGYFSLYKFADSALYHRKNNGKNGISFYNHTIFSDNMTFELAHSAVGDSIDSEQCGDVEQKLAQYTFQMLYKSIDVETAVNRLLEIVGRAYGVSRVYIFENSEDGLCCNNTFEWCAPGILSEINNLQGIRYNEDLGGYLQNFNENGVFYCHDINTLNQHLYSILAPQGIRSLLQCAVIDKGQFKGYVGFDECFENCLWSKEQIRTLTLVSNVLSVFLIKLRLDENLEKNKKII